MNKKVKVVSLMDKKMYSRVMSKNAEQKLCSFAQLIKNEKDYVPSDEEIEKLLSDAEGCLTGWGVKIPESAIKNAKRLRIIGHVAGTVKPVVPKSACDKGIIITSAKAVMAKSVAEMTLALTVASLRNFLEHDRAFKERGTRGDENIFCSKNKGLYRSRIGLVGVGQVGRELINMLRPFGEEVEIWVYDPYLSEEEAEKLSVRLVSLKWILSECDVISLHAAATKETYHMIGKQEVKMIRDGAVFINTARGSLVDYAALFAELKTGRFKAALDVYLETIDDSLLARSPYRKLDNVIITPGIAGPSAQVEKQMGEVVAEDLHRFFSGQHVLFPADYAENLA